jgi:hypothetical protein
MMRCQYLRINMGPWTEMGRHDSRLRSWNPVFTRCYRWRWHRGEHVA